MIAIIGGNGYVGKAFQRYLDSKDEFYQVVSRADLNYYEIDTLIGFLREAKPTFLINAAGYTGKPNVDACELDKHSCLLGNAVLPGVIRQACESRNIPWGHVSSGCIYSGRRVDGQGFTENDSPNFCFRTNNSSFYSGTKALGEEVLDGAKECFVWRLRIPFDHRDGPRNYLSKLLRYDRLLDAENSISHLDDFARACYECWNKQVPFGVYNVTNPGAVETREVVKMVKRFLAPAKQFHYFDSELQFMREAASAPRSNCVLSAKKLLGVGVKIDSAETALERALRSWEPE